MIHLRRLHAHNPKDSTVTATTMPRCMRRSSVDNTPRVRHTTLPGPGAAWRLLSLRASRVVMKRSSSLVCGTSRRPDSSTSSSRGLRWFTSLAASDWSMEGDPSVTAPASNEATEAPVGSADAGPAEGQQAASQADEGGENAGSAQQEELVPPEVNAEIIKQLLEFGFSPNRAVRAAYFSGNSTVEGALNWLEEHAEDNDLDDELVVPKESATSKKKKLTKEELEQRLKRARELRAKQEKEADLNREKMRIRMGREIAEARRIEEDQARMRLQIERQKEREEKERAMAAVKAKLEADRRERRRALGLPEELTEEEKAAEAEKERQKQEAEAKRFGGVVKPVTALTRLRDALVALKKDHEALAPVAFKTLAAYIGNVLRSPDEDKYRRINLENAAFQNRVGCLPEGMQFLEIAGFQKTGTTLVMEREAVNEELLRGAMAELDSAMNNPFFGAL